MLWNKLALIYIVFLLGCISIWALGSSIRRLSHNFLNFMDPPKAIERTKTAPEDIRDTLGSLHWIQSKGDCPSPESICIQEASSEMADDEGRLALSLDQQCEEYLHRLVDFNRRLEEKRLTEMIDNLD